MSSSSRLLAVCVDDFGLHAGVNAAVLDLLALGRISAVSCLVDGATWSQDASALKTAAYAIGAHGERQADVGLHLNLTECLDPVAQAACPSRPLGALIQAAYLRRLDPACLRREVSRQWDRFVEMWGAEPDFIDGHQHVHQLPQVREALAAVLADKLTAGARPWVRRCRAPGWRACLEPRFWGDAVKAEVIGALGSAALSRRMQRLGVPTSAHLLGVYPFDADESAYLQRWRGWLNQSAPRGDVIMCHPAKPGVSVDGVPDVIGPSREMEYRVLTGAAWGALLVSASVRVAPLSGTLR